MKISLIEDREVFKICLEYWNKLVLDLYNEVPIDFVQSPLLLGSIVSANSRRTIYVRILSSLRHVMISKMVKPEEVFQFSTFFRF